MTITDTTRPATAPATRVPVQQQPRPVAAPGRAPVHQVDPRAPRPATPPARRDLFGAYLDHRRRRAGADCAPHRMAHDDFCTRLRIPEQISETLWGRWLRHYLRFGPDWA